MKNEINKIKDLIEKYEKKADDAHIKANQHFKQSDIDRCYKSAQMWLNKANKLRNTYNI